MPRVSYAELSRTPGVWFVRLSCGHSVSDRGPLQVGMMMPCRACEMFAAQIKTADRSR